MEDEIFLVAQGSMQTLESSRELQRRIAELLRSGLCGIPEVVQTIPSSPVYLELKAYRNLKQCLSLEPEPSNSGKWSQDPACREGTLISSRFAIPSDPKPQSWKVTSSAPAARPPL